MMQPLFFAAAVSIATISFLMALANLTQLLATLLHFRPWCGRLRAKGPIAFSFHMLAPLVSLCDGASALLSAWSSNQTGIGELVTYHVFNLGNFLLQTWLLIVVVQTLRAAYLALNGQMVSSRDKSILPCWVQPTLLAVWVPFWLLTPASVAIGVITDDGRLRLATRAYNMLLFFVLLIVLILAYRRLRVATRTHSSSTGSDLTPKVRRHMHLLLLLALVTACGCLLYAFVFSRVFRGVSSPYTIPPTQGNPNIALAFLATIGGHSAVIGVLSPFCWHGLSWRRHFRQSYIADSAYIMISEVKLDPDS